MVAGWQADRVGFDAVQREIPSICGGFDRRKADECFAVDGGNEEFPAALLLQRVRHGDQSGVDADGKEILFVSNRGHIYGTGGFWR